MEVWLHAFANAGRVAPRARQAEAWGYTGLLVADSQCLNADVWVELALAAAATRRLRVGPGVTNPATRHVTVTASAAATLQAESGGRALVGVGRGDSAVTKLGRRPVPEPAYARFLARLAALLRGESVEIDGTAVTVAAAAHGPPPPIDGWTRTARQRPSWCAGTTASFARFSAQGAPADGRSEMSQAVIAQVGAAFDHDRHGHAGAAHARAMPNAFIERFAVVGPADHVVDRLRELAGLGLYHAVVVPGSLEADPARVAESDERFATKVLPRL
jgi:5,10-methylenetetrahydromethanopterin reductase